MGNKESEDTWTEFFRHMVGRGLRMPTSVTSDGAPGLVNAIGVVFDKSVRIRCWYHRLGNIRAKLPDDPAAEVMAEIVFADRGELEALEAITHPHIFGRIRSRVEGIEGSVAVEMPILEHGLGPGWARLVVDCADDVRLSRAITRGLSESKVKSRMGKQPSRGTWLAAADVVVPNHGDLEDLESTLRELIEVPEPRNRRPIS